jgi:hypothetical protein
VIVSLFHSVKKTNFNNFKKMSSLCYVFPGISRDTIKLTKFLIMLINILSNFH